MTGSRDADTDPQSEQTIISLPHKICLSILNTPEIAPWWPVLWIDQQNPTVTTRLLLVEAYLQGEDSRFFPYIGCLPQPTESKPFETTLYWSEDERVVIQGTNLYQATRTRLEKWKLEFSSAKELLLSLCPEQSEHLELYTYGLYCWAATVLTSRCFPGRLIGPPDKTEISSSFKDSIVYKRWLAKDPMFSFPALLPVLDLANHDPSALVTWETTQDSVKLKAALSYQRETELFNNYGQKSNEELILGYGFDLEDNRANHVGLALSVGTSEKVEFIKSKQNDRIYKGHQNADISLGIASAQKEPTIYALRADVHPLSSPAATPLSILAMNSRELFQQFIPPNLLPDVTESRFPTRLKVICAVQFLTKLGQQYDRIRVYDDTVPNEQTIASSRTLQMGKRYRDNQIQILKEGILRCQKTLRTWIKSGKILSLDTLATSFLPEDVLKKYRQALHRVLGTRNVRKIRQRGQEELAYVLWMITVTRSVIGPDAESVADARPPGMTSIAQLRSWVKKLFFGYGKLGFQDSKKLEAASAICWNEQSQTSLVETAAIFEQSIKSGLGEHEFSGTLTLETNDGKLEVGLAALVAWAIRVIREEGVIIPSRVYETEGDGLTDGEEDEFVLVFEDDDD